MPSNQQRRCSFLLAGWWGAAFITAGLMAAEPPAGNMLANSGFETDYHNNGAEGHVLAFMGDWSFNASDLKPDYWKLDGRWQQVRGDTHAGEFSLRLQGGGAASRSVLHAAMKAPPGGGDQRWGATPMQPIPYSAPERLARTVTLSLWYKSSNLSSANPLVVEVRACNTAKSLTLATPASTWKQATLTLPREEIVAAYQGGKSKGTQLDIGISLRAGGAADVLIDDVTLTEDHGSEASLAVNPGFEENAAAVTGNPLADGALPAGWSTPKKYSIYTQQYYKWTSWNHFFSPIRGTATTNNLVAHSGRQSLLMRVLPGDEMLVEGAAIPLQQTQAGIVEIGAYVLLDHLKWIDLQAADQEGNEIPSVNVYSGGWPVPGDLSQWYPSQTSDWVYIRKQFYSSTPLKAIRPRLCARGFNGDTRDDGGFRPHVNQVGLAFWDDVHVAEVSATPAELQARGIKAPPAAPASAEDQVSIVGFDLGERLFGANTARIVVKNQGTGSATVSLAITTLNTPPAKPQALAQGSLILPAGGTGTLLLNYTFTAEDMRPTWTEQGVLGLNLTVAGNTRIVRLPYNTWPVVVDVDFHRHYATPDENPQTISLNFGVAAQTLKNTKSVTLKLRRLRDRQVVDTVTISDLQAELQRTRQNFPALSHTKWESPNPVQLADRKNLLAWQLDLSKLPVHPATAPVRDHFLEITGLDAAGQTLFTDSSQLIGRVQPNAERLEKITSTAVREDGAVLVNGKPLFLMAGNMYTCGHYALSPQANKKFGFNSLRWVETADAATKFWQDSNLYSMETMVRGAQGTEGGMSKLVQAGKLDGSVTLAQFYESGTAYDDAKATAGHREFTRLANTIAHRISNFGGGGAHNLYTVEKDFDSYDTFGLELEPQGPPRGGYELAPALRQGKKAWFHLPQGYNNTPYDQFRFDQYALIVQGGRGFSVIHGLGDPSFMRGITGEIRHLSPAIFSTDAGPAETTVTPDLAFLQRRVGQTTTLIALSKPAIEMGRWTKKVDPAAPGGQAHTGISEFAPLPTPDGIRLHGFRETKPIVLQAGDKIVQHVWLDPQAVPQAIAWGVRGDAKWDFNAHYGQAFDFAKWRANFINFWFGGELLAGTWQIGWVYDEQTKKWFADHILTPKSFPVHSTLPQPGKWTKLEFSADEVGLVGKQVDGFMFLSQHGEAWWANSSIVRGNREILLCDSSVTPHHADLKHVKFNVPWAKEGSTVRVLFEERDLKVQNGAFVDDFRGVDTYQTIRGGAVGDALGWHPHGTTLKAQTIGYVTPSGPVEVHVYEITP